MPMRHQMALTQPPREAGVWLALWDAVRAELQTGSIADSLLVAVVGLIVLGAWGVCALTAFVVALAQQREQRLWRTADEPLALPAPH